MAPIAWPVAGVLELPSRKARPVRMIVSDDMPFDGKRMVYGGFEPLVVRGTARIERGAGRIPVLRLHFVIENAQAQLKGTKKMVLCGAKAPFAFFAYPDKPSVLAPDVHYPSNGNALYVFALPEKK